MKKLKGRPILRGILTVVLLCCLMARAVRLAGSWETVARFYGFGVWQGTFWFLICRLLFLAPFLIAAAAALSLWLKGRMGERLGLLSLLSGIFFCFGESLILFARMVNGNTGYVGAEPLLSMAVCMASGISLLPPCRRSI